MRNIYFILLVICPLSIQAEDNRCGTGEKLSNSDKSCEEAVTEVDTNVYPNNISSRAQAVARAEAAKAKRDAARQKQENKDSQ